MELETIQLREEVIEEPTYLDRVRESERCLHCNSKSLLDSSETIICEDCGCVHTVNCWEYRIPVGKLEEKSKGAASWVHEDGSVIPKF